MKLIMLLVAAIVTTGCTTPSRMNVQDLNHFRIDCDRRVEQLAFLRSQLPTRDEKMYSAFRVTSVVGTTASIIDGTYHEERAVVDRKHESIIHLTIYQIETYCPKPKPKPQGCIHINESFPAGSSQGARCFQAGKTHPVVNRWEMIDPN